MKIYGMANSHEKADVIIVNEVMSAARQGYNTIHVVCDDTDVFVLLVHFCKTLYITLNYLWFQRFLGLGIVSSIYIVGKVKALPKGNVPPPMGNEWPCRYRNNNKWSY